ncbi:MAG: protein-L-isoaspartate(D-aspartate) O-methyltransferase [Alphaproteobacteria bacterium]
MIDKSRKIRLLMSLRKSGVTDTAVLGAIERVPREVFVAASFQDQAYEDMALPIGMGQTISQPLVVALMTQALEVTNLHKVLEIGTGSGYQAAVLAKLCRRLYTIERHKELLNAALEHFATLRLHNIIALCGDGTLGWPEQAPFERIIVTAAHAGRDPPKALTDQLGVGGVMVIPMGDDRRDQYVMRYRRTDTGLERDVLWPVRFVPLLPDPPERPVHTGHI